MMEGLKNVGSSNFTTGLRFERLSPENGASSRELREDDTTFLEGFSPMMGSLWSVHVIAPEAGQSSRQCSKENAWLCTIYNEICKGAKTPRSSVLQRWIDGLKELQLARARNAKNSKLLTVAFAFPAKAFMQQCWKLYFPWNLPNPPLRLQLRCSKEKLISSRPLIELPKLRSNLPLNSSSSDSLDF